MLKESKIKLRHLKHRYSPTRFLSSVGEDQQAWKRFWHSYKNYQLMATAGQKINLDYLYPCLGDDTAKTDIEPIYFYQNTWACGEIIKQMPSQHIDVGSHHFYVALLSKVVPVTMVDIRPLSLPLDTLEFVEGSILELPFADSSVESLSSLCVIEHIGLGRYGDPLDPNGSHKSAQEFSRVIQPGGNLYISLPLDDENRTYFNAHRAFTEETVLTMFAEFEVIDKKYIYGNNFSSTMSSGFGTGCYHLRKLA